MRLSIYLLIATGILSAFQASGVGCITNERLEERFGDFEGPTIDRITVDCCGKSENQRIIVCGTMYGEDMLVKFGSKEIRYPKFDLASEYVDGQYLDTIEFNVPTGVVGIVEVVLTRLNPLSGVLVSSNKVEFEYVAHPEVFSVEPDRGPASGGTEVTITGRGFCSRCEAYFTGFSYDSPINGLVVEDEETIRGVTTAHPAGEVEMVVTCEPDECPASARASQVFEYYGSLPGRGQPWITGGSLQYVAIGDVTAGDDGQKEIVVAVYDELVGSTSLLVLRGDTYELVSSIELAADSRPRGVTLTDFDPVNENGLDAAVSLEDANQVAVLLNNGLASVFSSPLYLEVGDSPYAIVHGDFDGDGLADDLATPNLVGGVSVIFGNDDGSFTESFEIDVISEAGGATLDLVSIATGDFDRAGNTDLIVASPNTDEMIVLYNQSTVGVASFVVEDMNTEDEPRSVVGADFDADGIDDIASVNRTASTLSYRSGHAAGGFGALHSTDIWRQPVVMIRGSFGVFGWLAVGSREDGGVVDLRDGDGGNSTFKLISAGGEILSMAAGDLNNDGIDDLVVGMEGSDSIVIVRSPF